MSLFTNNQSKLRIAVVGLGYISQVAVLPAFKRVENCELAALVSGDKEKLKKLGEMYKVKSLYTYEEYDDCLRSKKIDAVYIALPNVLHKDFVIRAAAAGIHVLCEKPLAVSSRECMEMIDACKKANIQLMVAYRLHFESTNLHAINSIVTGQIGEVRVMTSTFGQQVKAGDIRTKKNLGGGALFDLGIYCINAARYFFRAEPIKVTALISNPNDARFDGVDAITCAILEFGPGRLATLATGLAIGEISSCTVVGEKGVIKFDPAFDFQLALSSEVVVDGKHLVSRSTKSDQFAGELKKFGDFILSGEEVRPNGYEGLVDVRIMEAILQSAASGQAVSLEPTPMVGKRPALQDLEEFRPISPPELFHASSPSGE